MPEKTEVEEYSFDVVLCSEVLGFQGGNREICSVLCGDLSLKIILLYLDLF
jgi:hypothetical protein